MRYANGLSIFHQNIYCVHFSLSVLTKNQCFVCSRIKKVFIFLTYQETVFHIANTLEILKGKLISIIFQVHFMSLHNIYSQPCAMFDRRCNVLQIANIVRPGSGTTIWFRCYEGRNSINNWIPWALHEIVIYQSTFIYSAHADPK